MPAPLHTPSPWVYDSSCDRIYADTQKIALILLSDIASRKGTDDAEAEGLANGRLMAAAPQLRAALLRMVDGVCPRADAIAAMHGEHALPLAIRQAREAIAQAGG